MTVLVAGACSDGTSSTPARPTVTSEATPAALHLLQPLAVHHTTALQDGRLLFTGGCTLPGCEGFDAARATQFFDPRLGRFSPGPTMLSARAGGTATLLRDGRVLLAGGYPAEGQAPTAATELYDPDMDRFTAASPMLSARADHSASLLPTGRVLVCGGFDTSARAQRSCEVFDPGTNSFANGPRMSAARGGHAASLVHDRVVLIGGTSGNQALASTDELVGGRWAPGPSLLVPRVKLEATTLPGGRVLVMGGATSTEGRERLASTEIIDVQRATVTAGPDLSEGQYKLDGAVARLRDGRLVIAGGRRLNVYDPHENTITVLQEPLLQQRSFVTATTVGPRTVLVAGGYDDAIVPSDAATLIHVPG